MSDSSRKEQILQLICANPFISQQELASECGLSRSAVAGHIASLIRERRLLGRAYVLPDARQVLCLGGANIDRKLRTLDTFALATSNPVSQYESFGGVARNIAENLARLLAQAANGAHKVGLISAFGDDAGGRALQAHAQAVGLDLRLSLQMPQHASDSYTAVLDQKGDMLLALAHMQLVEHLTPAFLAGCYSQRQHAAMLIADMNLPADSIAQLLQEAQNDAVPLVMVAVSQPKMARLPENLHGLGLLLLNRDELATRLGLDSLPDAQLPAACTALQQQGVKQLIVTLGAQGVCYSTPTGVEWLAAPEISEVQDVTGAGDAFAAAVCFSLLQTPHDLHLACRRGLTLAALTLQCSATVCPEIHAQCLQMENLLI